MSVQDFVTPLLTVLGSGIIAALVSSSLSEGKDRWQIRRQKAEELFKTLHKYKGDLDKHHFNNLNYLTGRFNRQQYHEATQKDSNPTDDYRDLQMNIYLYEPRLIPLFDRVVEARTALNSIVSRCEVARREAERIDRDAYREFNLGWDRLNSACDELQREIVAIGRRIAEEGTQAERMISACRRKVADGVWKARGSLPVRLRRSSATQASGVGPDGSSLGGGASGCGGTASNGSSG